MYISIKTRLVAIVFIIALILTSLPVVNAADEISLEDLTVNIEKRYSQAKLEDNFTDNEVLIFVYPQYNEKEYTVEDFSEINCIAIEELMTPTDRLDVPTRSFCLTIEGHSKQNVLNAVEKLEKRSDICCSDVNLIYEIEDFGEDSFDENISSVLSPNGMLAASDAEIRWALEKISIEGAWKITTGSSSVLVGVADTGVYAAHTDLTDRVDKQLSKSFLINYNDPFEDVYGDGEVGHGTMVAGIIGAKTDNNVGIDGVCKNVTLVSLRTFYKKTDDPQLKVQYSSKGLQAILEHARKSNIKIINYSIGGPTKSSVEEQAIEAYPGLLICSAGNSNADTDSDKYNNYPSEYDLPNIISVGASNEADERREYYDEKDKVRKGSNYGKITVDLFAPGHHIWSLSAKGGIRRSGGTSLAAPYVTGVAALILAKDPTLSPSEIKATIMDNVDKVSALSNLCVSGGRLNAEKALKNIQKHTWAYTPISASGGHKMKCTECGYEEVRAHTWTYTLITVAKGHKKTCAECGYEEVGAHKWIKIYAEKPYVCTFCGISTSIVPANFTSISDILEENEGEVLICPITDLADYIEKYLGSIRNT